TNGHAENFEERSDSKVRLLRHRVARPAFALESSRYDHQRRGIGLTLQVSSPGGLLAIFPHLHL
ncbi:hypothetical protein, partial [Mesorhizobium sp.]|uniref:hypothetical protein n=1 Tax=Mesorhizobium sp. TaxID=1871066 RepID=UPI00257A2990